MAHTGIGDGIWGFVVVGGFIILGLAILVARLRNKTTPEQHRRTEEGSRQLYRDTNEEDRSRTP